ncbi:MAG: hypothetical protein JWM97_2372 [Phycisphaerales bacterium]|nr:hypothetical protein [Phycisphaerales bacterium]
MRRLFTLLSALSLLLCVGTCAMWVRSYKGEYALALEHFSVLQDLGGDTIYEPGDVGWNLQREVAAYHGTIGLHQLRLCPRRYAVPDGPKRVPGWHFDGYFDDHPYRPMPAGLHWKVVAARCGGPKPGRANAEFRAGCPMWMVIIATTLIPGMRLGLWLNRKRRGQFGHCLVCGYDLRATPNRCPECGAETKIPAASAGGDKRAV